MHNIEFHVKLFRRDTQTNQGTIGHGKATISLDFVPFVGLQFGNSCIVTKAILVDYTFLIYVNHRTASEDPSEFSFPNNAYNSIEDMFEVVKADFPWVLYWEFTKQEIGDVLLPTTLPFNL